jgi:hypothetical protein
VISVPRTGSMRSPVIVIGGFALKFARDRRGRASNLYEAKLYRSANATRRPAVPGSVNRPWVPTPIGELSY